MATVRTRPIGPRAIAIPLQDGDELWNAAKVAEYLEVDPVTIWGYASKHLPKNHPFPVPEPDPVGLIVHDPVQADAIRLLVAADARVARGQTDPGPPRLWRASRVLTWHDNRPGRGNWNY